MTFNESLKNKDIIHVDYYNPLKQAIEQLFEPIRQMQVVFQQCVYLEPDIFDAFLEDNNFEADLVKDEINFTYEYVISHPNEFLVYTRPTHTRKGKKIEFITSKEIAKTISLVDEQYKKKYVWKNKLKYFDKKRSKLIIDGNFIDITKDSDIYNLCCMLFGSKQYLYKIWTWDEILVRVLDSNREIINAKKTIYLKVKRLNTRIQKLTGYTEVILFKNKTISINPEYIELFK